MKISVIALGSRGDVEPFVALALGLKAAGHDVVMGSGHDFRDFVTSRGMAFVPVGGDMRAALNTPEGKALFRSKNPFSFIRRLRAAAEPVLATMQEDILKATGETEACIFSYLCGPVVDIHEATGLPAFMGMLQPLVPTKEFPIAASPVDNLGPFNRLSYRALNGLMLWMFGDIANRWRKERFGLPPVSGVKRLEQLRIPQMVAISPSVIRPPSDWPEFAHLTGYWFLPPPSGWTSPPELEAFLADGPPPVVVGFGSMIDDDAAALSGIIEEALEKSGMRGVLIGGWGGLSSGSSRHLCLESVPFEWLFPRVAAVVHHGGAGTTAAALRAGIPQVIVPFFGDQHWWGRLVKRIGAGPAPIPRSRLDADRLAAAIKKATSKESMRQTAVSFGEAIRLEDGIARAVSIIEEGLATFPR